MNKRKHTTWSVGEEIQKRCDKNPEFKKAWEERKQFGEAFEKAAEPLVMFLQTYCHPHMKAIVDCETAELLEGDTIIKYEIREE